MKIIILDFCKGEVFIKPFDTINYTTVEDQLIDENFNLNDCEYMVVDKLILNID